MAAPEPTNSKMIFHKWEPIVPLTGTIEYDFSETDALQRQWLAFKQVQEAGSPDAYADFTARLTRSWAIETGIIEGLYDLDLGVTQTLVMHGISADRIERSDTNKDPKELVLILDDHQDTVAGVYSRIRDERPITRIAIQQIHAQITQNQPTYRAFNPSVGCFNASLQHGEFKKLPNSPTRPDGKLHEYCPPEQVESELDNLIEWYGHYQNDKDRYHPLLVAAWLHHCFTQIHPFPDGNGRVARTLLTWHLVREGYLPVVVKRDDRETYIRALANADRGDLVPFVDLLVDLQRRTILNALDEPGSGGEPGLLNQVLVGIRERMHRRSEVLAANAVAVTEIAGLLRDGLEDMLEARSEHICSFLGESGLRMTSFVDHGGPGEKEHWYRNQVVQTARNSGHWANLNEPRFFVKLALTPDRQFGKPRLSFVVSLHHTGRQQTGIMAATSFAIIVRYHDNISDGIEEASTDEFVDCTLFPFTITWESKADALRPRLEEWVEQSLSIALRQWGQYIS